MVKNRGGPLLILESGTYTYEQLASMGYEDLTNILDEISDIMADISNQLNAANADYVTEGISSDYKWFTKAKSKLRILERYRQKVSRLKKAKRTEYNMANRTLGDIFIDIAKVRLDSEVFRTILDEAMKEKALNEKVMKGELT